jgi:cytochrome c oxidase subunit 2
MRTQAEVMTQAAFDQWLRSQGDRMETPGEAGPAVFEEQGCGGCHAFEPAGSSSTTGPPLDDLEARARQVGAEPEQFVRESIVEPNAVVHPDYQPNVMPATFAQLPKDQLDALVRYLLQEEGG